MSDLQRRVMLVILDGWGHSEKLEHNAIAQAKTPTWDKLQQQGYLLLDCFGSSVGLPVDQMGNSEVGHMHMGAGRVLPQEITRINQIIQQKKALLSKELLQKIQQQDCLHLLGLLSDGGVHSHISHLLYVIKEAAKVTKNIYVHAFLDGRDTPPKSAEKYLLQLEETFNQVKAGQLASVSGRFYAMDRDNNWDRTECAFAAITGSKTTKINNTANKINDDKKVLEYRTIKELITQLYVIKDEQELTDEFVRPVRVKQELQQAAPMLDLSAPILCINFRKDRVKAISKLFAKFESYYTLTEYGVVGKPILKAQKHTDTLAEILSKKNIQQLRIAETEKYAHVTFFFNVGKEDKFSGEDRVLVPSKKVFSYTELPQMSAHEITQEVVKAIRSNKHQFIVCNYANADMVGHTGDMVKTVQAIECLDKCLNEILSEARGKVDVLITADHGNAEQMFDHENDSRHTAHTMSKVPLIYIPQEGQYKDNLASGSKSRFKLKNIKDAGLIDIAPTILHLLSIDKPASMTGCSLIEHR